MPLTNARSERKITLRWRLAKDFYPEHESSTDFKRNIEWLQNAEVNIPYAIGSQSIAGLPKIEGSALVIDKSMASTQFYKQLPAIKDYKGTVICCDRALYSVIPYKLPAYVCNLDSSSICISFFDRLDVKEVMDKITAVFAITTNPLTIRHWHGNRVFFCGASLNLPLTKGIMEVSQTPYMETGGNVATFAYILAYNLGANPIGLFGITNSYDSPAENEYPQMYKHLLKKKKGPYGKVWQDPVYARYNDTMLGCIEHLARTEKIQTINTINAGLVYSRHVVPSSLEKFVRAYV